MSAVRYRPGEALRWLESGPERMKESSLAKATSVLKRAGARSVGRDIKETAGAIWDAGSAALAELSQRQVEASSYLIEDDGITVTSITGDKKYSFTDIQNIQVQGDKYVVELTRGSFTIKPFAYIVAGRIKVPVGWSRNGIEVPFEQLIEELAARCDMEI